MSVDIPNSRITVTLDAQDDQAMPIPMFHSVYHDYHMTYGTVSTFVSRTKIPTTFEWFRCGETLCLVGGNQLMISGAFAGDENKDALRPYFDYMNMLTQARKAARVFFNLGVWQPPLPLECARKDVVVKETEPPKRNVPAVLSGCYALDGALCIVLVNHTDAPQTVRFFLDPAAYGMTGERYALTRVHPRRKDLGEVGARGETRSLSLPAAGASVLVLGESGHVASV